MGRASHVLADGLPEGVLTTYVTPSKCGQVPYSTIYHRVSGQPSKEDKAKSEQYFTPSEEKVRMKYLLRIITLGFPIRMKHLPLLASIIVRRHSMTDGVNKPPGKNWPSRNALQSLNRKTYKIQISNRKMSIILTKRESCCVCSVLSRSW